MQFGERDWTISTVGTHLLRGDVSAAQLPLFASDIKQAGGRLITLWGSDDRHLTGGFALHTVFITAEGLVWTRSALPPELPAYPDLSAIFLQAGRMQRATRDLLGIRAEGAVDQRKWLRHGAWPADAYPLRKDFATGPTSEPDAYPIITVNGEGVHEIAVGPIHAGTIEPGHFRFSVVGEKILKLEERLGYTHKGVEKRFEGMDLNTGAKLAGRISGDTHSAYAWAYCMAVENALGTVVPQRALLLRALFLEIERVSNHLGDLGYLGNDAGLSFGFVQFWRLKEDWLRLSARLFGHRYLFDRVVPGGVATDLSDASELLEQVSRLETEIRELQDIYDEHAGIQDRFASTGVVRPDLAASLGLTGLAGRASAQAWDARVQFPLPPYDMLDVTMATHRHGDVLARAELRFVELFESLRLIRKIVRHLPDSPLLATIKGNSQVREGLGWVEGWRGEVLFAVRIGKDGRLDRAHPHDPSWQNWPALEVAILGNIVPDFPLINKSFNLGYSAQDL